MNYYSSSPTVVLPPQDPLTSNPGSNFTDKLLFGQPSPSNHSSWTPSKSLTPLTTNPSRKRSRDEAASPDDRHLDGSSYFAFKEDTLKPKTEPIYGEGMTLIQPSGFIISAESQTGTWAEEKAEKENLPSSSISTTGLIPSTTSRKFQRLDTTAPGLGDVAIAASVQAMGSPPKSGPSDPTVDDFTYLLGIGWTRLSEHEDVQAAARGWAKFIENHYSIQSVKVLLKSKGLNAYLTGAAKGFFLFQEDLMEGRFVGETWDRCLTNIQSLPMVFDGAETLKATRILGLDSSRNTIRSEDKGQSLNEIPLVEDPLARQEFAMELD
ncbi:MAG: hypothetical protein M1827_005294 [Pycnora praestabilis]|nr:MAG: hypothetical protein M1827_005294 [Pycnora praestabilis]